MENEGKIFCGKLYIVRKQLRTLIITICRMVYSRTLVADYSEILFNQSALS